MHTTDLISSSWLSDCQTEGGRESGKKMKKESILFEKAMMVGCFHAAGYVVK